MPNPTKEGVVCGEFGSVFWLGEGDWLARNALPSIVKGNAQGRKLAARMGNGARTGILDARRKQWSIEGYKFNYFFNQLFTSFRSGIFS